MDALFFGKGFASAFYGHGFDADDPATITQDRDVPAEEEMGYRWTLLAYQDGSPGRTMALHAYQRLRRTYEPSRDGMLLSNTWGDRSQDARMCQEFMLREISAGACLGADVVQLDDGWQAGVTSNSVTAGGAWEGFWARGSFWTVHPQRFPQSLAPLVEAAATQSLRLGLWYAPDSADDIGNWQRDAQAILALHRRWGINYFKIDSISIRSKTAERNLQRLVAAIQADSGGRVVLDIDITAGKRGGYWFLLHAGPLFVENRYTDRRGYWPHQTLRNLWKLAHWVDPLRLRMEFLNPTRNQALYAADPLAPGAYSPQYLFATVMGCSPLGWFEMSHLPASFVSEVAKLVAIWKKHREAYFRGVILPIGAEPDGTSWTGFASITPDRHSAYLLLFREFNNRPNWEVELPLLIPGRYTATILAGTGDVNLANGRLRAGIPEPRGFLLVQVDRQ